MQGTLFQPEAETAYPQVGGDVSHEKSETTGEVVSPKDIKVTKRDMTVLQWIAEQTVVRFDLVCELLGRAWDKKQRKHQKTQVKLSESNTKRIIGRWRALGLVETRKPFYEQPYFVWVSQHGLYELDRGYKAKKPSLILLEHYHQINRVRLWAEGNQERLHVHEWQSERWLKHQWSALHEKDPKKQRRDEHTPDALIVGEVYAGTAGWKRASIAVEVELTLKKAQRLQDTIIWLNSKKDYQAVWYFVSEITRQDVIELVKDYPKFTVYDSQSYKRLYPL